MDDNFAKDSRLIIDFPDVEDRRYPGAFNGAHARRIITFVNNLPSNVTDLYVCCSKGGSRSPAVAAALLRAFGRSDDCIWKNPFYSPNTLVYYWLCRELQLSISKIRVKYLTYINNKAFRDAQAGKKCKYERWEIIE